MSGAQAGSLLPFPLPARGGGLLGVLWGPGCSPARRLSGGQGCGAARPRDTARALSSNSGGGRGVTGATRPRAGRAAPVTRPSCHSAVQRVLKDRLYYCQGLAVLVLKVVEAGLYWVLSNLL